MHLNSVKYITFKTFFSMYQYNIMSFDLTEGFSFWQYYINDILFEFLRKFCSVYLNDIFIYSNNLAEHKQHVCKIIVIIQAVSLQINIDKSEFYVQKTPFLSVIVSVNSIRMNLKKIEVIVH